MRALIYGAILAVAAVPGWSAGDVPVDEIIKKFAAKEAEFAQARGNYTYRQSVKMEELDPNGNPSGGKWEEVDDIIFSPDGKRAEKVVYAPVQNLHNIGLTPDDINDLRNVQPFVLTTSEVAEYDINYLGKEKLDEINCYAFAVKPKKMIKGKRYFEGQIWVDDQDLQIVKTYGKGVGLANKDTNQFPKFETYREQIDKKYWFPTYTHADDTLRFKDFSQRIRMTVKYQDYKKFEGRSTIKYGEAVDETKPATPPSGKKQ
jgi:hypothetical protein